MNVQDCMAAQTERMAASMTHFLVSMPEDKLTWVPAIDGSAPLRNALQQTGECIVVNRLIAAVLRGEDVKGTPGAYPEPAFANAQEAGEQLRTSAQELASAIRAMTEGDLTRVYAHPRGQMQGQNILMMCLRNMAYHSGQINLLQMLYGDPEFHVPPNWR